ncbi:hypothetical protein MES4922_530037 [Mesorhizobium ventifaucium]|uniref:Uncharacterized protein n=1 Tax=Mesorhizobium ventifaucium TaxID=666020 RepID=A0ABM9EBM4_9HYPH|nr:hypothetical protein MES4922_530037 [Mesorhizobium ventifaucium]
MPGQVGREATHKPNRSYRTRSYRIPPRVPPMAAGCGEHRYIFLSNCFTAYIFKFRAIRAQCLPPGISAAKKDPEPLHPVIAIVEFGSKSVEPDAGGDQYLGIACFAPRSSPSILSFNGCLAEFETAKLPQTQSWNPALSAIFTIILININRIWIKQVATRL